MVVAKAVAGIVIGGALGFAVGKLSKCTTGACPLNSNPVVSTFVWALLGLMIATG